MLTFAASLSDEEGMDGIPQWFSPSSSQVTNLILGNTSPHTPCLTFKTISGLNLSVSSPSSAFITSSLSQLYCQELQSHAGIQQSFHPRGAGMQACGNGIWGQRLSWLQQKIKHPQLTGSEHYLGIRKGGSKALGESTEAYCISKAALLEKIHR